MRTCKYFIPRKKDEGKGRGIQQGGKQEESK
jgi:hypothetical protein